MKKENPYQNIKNLIKSAHMRTENQRYCIIGGLHIFSRKNLNAIKYKIRPCIFENPLMSSCYLGYVIITLTIVRIVSCGVRSKMIRKSKQFVTIPILKSAYSNAVFQRKIIFPALDLSSLYYILNFVISL